MTLEHYQWLFILATAGFAMLPVLGICWLVFEYLPARNPKLKPMATMRN